MSLRFNDKLIHDGDVIVIALSGGVDSVVLTKLLLDQVQKKHLRLYALHMNHHKRTTALRDEEFVKAITSRWNIPCQIVHFQEKQGNFHQEARSQRLEELIRYAKKVGANKIAFAHHLDDQAETILMRLSRGSSFKGYGGIEEVVEYCDMTLIRPLLHESKEAIIQYAIDHQIDYVQDESNDGDDYTRNRYRHHVIPWLKEESPSALHQFDDFATMLQQANLYLSHQVDKYYKDHVTKEDDSFLFMVSHLKNEDDFLIELILQRLIRELSNQTKELSKTNLLDLIKMIRSDKPNLSFSKYHLIYAYKNYDVLTIQTKPRNIVSFDVVLEGFQEVLLPENRKLVVSEKPCINSCIYTELWYNDLDFIFPLTVRTRKEKDTLSFSFGTKKLKSLYIDKKIPMEERNSLPVLVNSKGIILAIPGIYAYASKDAKNVCYVTYQKG